MRKNRRDMPHMSEFILKLFKVENFKIFLLLFFVNWNIHFKKKCLVCNILFLLFIMSDSLSSIISFSVLVFITTLLLSSSFSSHFCQSALYTHKHIITYLLWMKYPALWASGMSIIHIAQQRGFQK